MAGVKKFLTLGFVPSFGSLGLLILRLGLGGTLFLRHGLEKLQHLPQMAAHFPDPLHIGVYPTLAFATLSDAICSILVALGLFTRWAALIVVVNIAVAWSLVLHYSFFGRGPGEICVLYLAGFLALFFAGAGRFSIDQGILPGKTRR